LLPRHAAPGPANPVLSGIVFIFLLLKTTVWSLLACLWSAWSFWWALLLPLLLMELLLGCVRQQIFQPAWWDGFVDKGYILYGGALMAMMYGAVWFLLVLVLHHPGA
jgi:hypothetical protein